MKSRNEAYKGLFRKSRLRKFDDITLPAKLSNDSNSPTKKKNRNKFPRYSQGKFYTILENETENTKTATNWFFFLFDFIIFDFKMKVAVVLSASLLSINSATIPFDESEHDSIDRVELLGSTFRSDESDEQNTVEFKHMPDKEINVKLEKKLGRIGKLWAVGVTGRAEVKYAEHAEVEHVGRVDANVDGGSSRNEQSGSGKEIEKDTITILGPWDEVNGYDRIFHRRISKKKEVKDNERIFHRKFPKKDEVKKNVREENLYFKRVLGVDKVKGNERLKNCEGIPETIDCDMDDVSVLSDVAEERFQRTRLEI